MNKSRKLLALVLAMIMAFSLMTVTAAAYDAGHEHDCAVCSEEGIQPRIPAMWCQSCSQEMGLVDMESIGNDTYQLYFKCSGCGTIRGPITWKP